jgi:hypothetical protein
VRSKELKKLIYPKVEKVKELKDGYSLVFKNDEQLAFTLLEFINFERQCCPSFTFVLHFEPEKGNIELHMRGSRDIKEMLSFVVEDIKK